MRATLTLGLLPALALACSASSPDPSAASLPELSTTGSSAIIRGTRSDATQDSTVLLMITVGNGMAGCTGTLLAPNLVLTARHCVSAIGGGGHACSERGQVLAGSGTFGADYAPSKIQVIPGATLPIGDPMRGPVGKAIFHAADATICRHDVALVVLDRGVDNPVIAPIRLAARPTTGESLTLVGWGLTEQGYTPSTRMQRAGVAVRRLGPQAPDDDFGAVPPRYFEVGEGICQGDSGGPAFAATTGAVVGVISQGGNGRGTSQDPELGCIGSDTRNMLAELPYARAKVEEAAAAAGAKLWLEGQPNPRASLAPFGAACARDADCGSNVCLADGTCSMGCFFGSVSCPGGYVCTTPVGTRDICTKQAKPAVPDAGARPRPGADGEEDDVGTDAPGVTDAVVIAPPPAGTAQGGCATAPSSGSGEGGFGAVLALLLTAGSARAARRSGRSRRSSGGRASG